ncbi:hypothetical protein GE061_018045 [Apolygus lucorum]|uniref:Uncharacterized protein n=1 Tax=Apolygus lucorum TaxID=248454 RepID=A0A8S9XE21_APOLU|nr:hypothetical protein GE061_018045 [Apolygus lucorum]
MMVTSGSCSSNLCSEGECLESPLVYWWNPLLSAIVTEFDVDDPNVTVQIKKPNAVVEFIQENLRKGGQQLDVTLVIGEDSNQ